MASDIVKELDRILADADPQWSNRESVQKARDLLARLPVNADGHRIAPGMIQWTPPLPSQDEPDRGKVLWIQVQGVNRLYACVGLQKGHGAFACPIELCYSTPEAARAAKEAT